jgi:diguanylate cyclase (GGDEF)-like protein
MTGRARPREPAGASATNGAAKGRSPQQTKNGNGRFVPSGQRGDASFEQVAVSLAARERLEVEDFRDWLASQRDKAAQERDELAAQRDRGAAICDQEASELDGRERLFDRHTLAVHELRARAAMGRRRAADDRGRAIVNSPRSTASKPPDREQARRDRERAARDRELAGIDELIGARRRGVGLEELRREIERARRTNGRLVAVFVDVDGLKSVNDEQGHRAGDQLLRDVAAALASRMRSYDLVVRVGGDEFLCVLPDVTPTEAPRALRRTRLRAAPRPGTQNSELRPQRPARRRLAPGTDRPRRARPDGRPQPAAGADRSRPPRPRAWEPADAQVGRVGNQEGNTPSRTGLTERTRRELHLEGSRGGLSGAL